MPRYYDVVWIHSGECGVLGSKRNILICALCAGTSGLFAAESRPVAMSQARVQADCPIQTQPIVSLEDNRPQSEDQVQS
jgi:hypothetical protein